MHPTIPEPRQAPIPPEQFADRIERLAFGRIRHLKVVCLESEIILEGQTKTYHAKQLAQEAVLDLIDGTPGLANRIEVR